MAQRQGFPQYVSGMEGYMGKENVDYFAECTSLKEVQTRYRSLTESYRPDMGRDAGVMATINAQYDLQRGYYKGKAAGETAMAQWSQEELLKSWEGEKNLALGSSLVSNEAADKLLNDPTSVAFLKKHGNLNLRKGMTQEQKRSAIRQAVEKVVYKEKSTAGEGTEEPPALLEGKTTEKVPPLKKSGENSRMKTKGTAAGVKGRKMKRPKLSKQEWRQVQSAQMKKYSALEETEIPESGYVFAHDKFYLIRNYGPGDFEVIMRLDPGTQRNDINIWLEEFRYGKNGKIGEDVGTIDGKYRSVTGGRDGSPTDPGDRGEYAGIFQVAQEFEQGPDGSGVLQESGGDYGLAGGAGSRGLTGQEIKSEEALTAATTEDERSQSKLVVSDEKADWLLGDQSSVSFLTRKGGLKLSKKMTREQRRAAVKKAVERITNKGTVSGDRGESIQMQLDSDDMVPQKEAQQQKIEKSEEADSSQSEKLISGALNPYSTRAQRHAEQYYESVRKMTTDVKRIAKNTGFSEEEIQRIKDFIFVNMHDLGDGRLSRFDSSYQMAQSWQRLIDGKNIQPHDLTLLRHEIMENELMDQGYTQDEAHRIASEKYDYSKESDEYYGSTEAD